MQLILLDSPRDPKPERAVALNRPFNTVGTDSTHDIQARAEDDGTIFSVIVNQGRDIAAPAELLSAGIRLRVNGRGVAGRTAIFVGDRIEWKGGVAILLSGTPGAGSSQELELKSGRFRTLEVLHEFASTLQRNGSIPVALELVLKAIVEMADADAGYLLSELAGEGGWDLLVSHPKKHAASSSSATRKELFSNTILQEAIERRAPVYIGSMIGHPHSAVASVIEARIFSAACFPLCSEDRTIGALFLTSRTPGRSIRKELFEEIRLLATHAALLLLSKVELHQARNENVRLRTSSPAVLSDATGLVYDRAASPPSPMSTMESRLRKIAPTELSVLIQGETGVGKEVAARALHALSARRQGPFVALNCAAIPPPLLESLLFGHERGAFTGATRSQPGKFAQASGGTLFLDEIAELPLEMQAKLLRVLQEKTVEPVGALRSVPIDVRVLAAANRDLEESSQAGRFRQDLYFRLNGTTLRLPALRDRKMDIATLALFFLARTGCDVELSSQAMCKLEAHTWPGNVRELEQVISRAALLAEGPVILPADLDLGSAELQSKTVEVFFSDLTLKDAQNYFTREYVQKILSKQDGNKSRTARLLEVSERTLYRILSPEA